MKAFPEGTNLTNLSLPLNLTDQQKIRIGTCAWSFQDWRGVLYPADLPESRWLEFYANYFPAVEVDSTFHAAPAEDTVRRWVEMTPAAFRFTCKLPRQITHTCRLRNCAVGIKLVSPRHRAARTKAPDNPHSAPAFFGPKGWQAGAAQISSATAARFPVCD